LKATNTKLAASSVIKHVKKDVLKDNKHKPADDTSNRAVEVGDNVLPKPGKLYLTASK
jgi:hypothetical protein